jgi:protein involved in polysaccharide export with SLBB domain
MDRNALLRVVATDLGPAMRFASQCSATRICRASSSWTPRAISLPPGGEIRGGGQTARQLEAEIEAALKSGGYLLDPQVSIEVLNYRPFYVIGEVNAPGSFEYIDGMTVITAVTLAGGFTYRAYQDGVAIERSGKECRAKPSTPLVPEDIIRIPERLFWSPFLNPGTTTGLFGLGP